VSPNIIWPGRSTARNSENICGSLAEFNATPSEAHNPVCGVDPAISLRRSPKSATPPVTRTSRSRRRICTWRSRMTRWGSCLGF